MTNKTSNIILIGMVLGAVLGVLGGYYFGEYLIYIGFLGTIFLNALKMIVVPLIVASMIVGVTSLGDVRKLGRTTGKTLLYYLVTTGFSVLIGIILVNIIRPGIGTGVDLAGREVPDLVAESGGKSLLDVVISLIPGNLIEAAANTDILPLIIFSLAFGAVLATLGKKARTVINFFEGLNAALMKLVVIIIYFAPIGVFAIIASIVAENRGSITELVSSLGLYSLTVLVGLAIHAVIILPLILKFFGKKNPFRYFLGVGQALATAFTTASSSATLPITMEGVEEKNKVDRKAASFVLPLGATINMDGTALYEAVAAIFIAQIYTGGLTMEQQVIIFLTATLASIGAAGIPHAGTVTMVFVLTAVGLPLEGIALIWAIDWFLDRCRTTVNVWGDSIGAAVIGETSEIKSTGWRNQRGRPSRDDRYRDRQPQRKDRRKSREDRRNQDRDSHQKRKQDTRQRQQRSDRRQQDRRQYDRSKQQQRKHAEKPQRQQHRPQPKPEPKPEPKGQPKEQSKPEQDLNISKETLDRELEKVRKQLDELNDLDVTSTPPEPEKKSESGKKEKDEFFGAEFSKMNLFEDKHQETETEEKPREEKPDREKVDTDSSKEIKEEKEKPVEESPEPDETESKKEETEKEDQKDEDMWGRTKSKKGPR